MDWLRKNKNKLSLGALLLLLALSWIYTQKAQKHSREELHGLLQEKTQMAISDYVEKKNPHIKSITFHKVWTKNTSTPQNIKVFFSYSLVTEEEAGGNLLVDGEALLKQSDDKEDHWILNDFKVTNSFLDFFEPMIIKAPVQN